MTSKLSVIMPLYNKEAYVLQAVESALAQGAGVAEIVVVDDGSSDGGPAIIEGLANTEPRVRLLRKPNGGVSSARNAGIRVATSEFVSFLDADDWYLPGYVDAMMNLVRWYPDAAMYCSGFIARFSDGRESPQVLDASLPATWHGAVSDPFSRWCRGSFTCTNAVLVRKQMLMENAIAFPEGEPLGEDLDVWFQLAELGTVVYLNAPLVAYRQDVVGSATSGRQVTSVLPCFDRLAARLARGDYPPALRKGARRLVGSHLLNVANVLLDRQDRDGARVLLRDARASWNITYYLRTVINFWRSAHMARGH